MDSRSQSDEIEYVVFDDEQVRDQGEGVEYELGAPSVDEQGKDGVQYDIGVRFDQDEDGVQYDMGVQADAVEPDAVEMVIPERSIVELPYIAEDALEEAPYEELLTLMKRSRELLEQAQRKQQGRRSVAPSAAPASTPASTPAPVTTPLPAQPTRTPSPPSQPAPAAAQPLVQTVVTEPIPLLPIDQYEQRAFSALAAMKAALGEGV